MTTVFVDFTNPRRPHEISRDARDPQGDSQGDLERYAHALSLSYTGRVVRIYPVGQYVKPWRKRAKDDCLYEAIDGRPTPDFR